MEQNNEEKLNRLLADYSKMGFNLNNHLEQILVGSHNPQTGFNTYDTFHRNGIAMDLEVRVAYNPTLDRQVIQCIEALVTDIKVPPKIIENPLFKELDALFQFNPTVDPQNSDSSVTVKADLNSNEKQINKKLKIAYSKDKEVFDYITAIHQPKISFDIDDLTRDSINNIIENGCKSAVFNSYYRLKPAEMFNLLTIEDTAVQKMLYKKDHEGSKSYTAWVRPKLGNFTDGGFTAMEMFKDFPLAQRLQQFNLLEVKDYARFSKLQEQLKEGAAVVCQNLNRIGEPNVLIRVDADYATVQLRSTTSGKILSHQNYKSDQIIVEHQKKGTKLFKSHEAPGNQQEVQKVSRTNTLKNRSTGQAADKQKPSQGMKH